MEVDRTAHLVLDEIADLAAGPQLLASDRHAADALGGALEQAVDVALAGGADHHDVIGTIPGGHAHSTQVVLEMT